jgi:voltage-gated sodium channel
MQHIRSLVGSDGFRSAILFLIVLNAFAMGLEATPAAADRYAAPLEWVFLVSQAIFVVEIVLRWIAAPRGEFFRDSWNRFDFIVVALSLIPALGEFALVARVFRVLRVLRIVSVSDVLLGSMLRKESSAKLALLSALLVILAVYVFSLIGFYVFGDTHQGWESLIDSAATLLRAATPTGFAALAAAGGGAIVFSALFYLALLSTACNLVWRITHEVRSESR